MWATLLRDLGAEQYRNLLEDHRKLLRKVFDRHGGYEVDSQGDAFFVAFDRPRAAVGAAADLQRDLADHVWPEGREPRVRVGIHPRHGGLIESLVVGGVDLLEESRQIRDASIKHDLADHFGALTAVDEHSSSMTSHCSRPRLLTCVAISRHRSFEIH